eukprot:530446-Rhodomonas_salina.1
MLSTIDYLDRCSYRELFLFCSWTGSLEDNSPALSHQTEQAGDIRRVDTPMGREELEGRRSLALQWLTATIPNSLRAQMVGNADPHHAQTLEAHTSGIGSRNHDRRKDGW